MEHYKYFKEINKRRKLFISGEFCLRIKLAVDAIPPEYNISVTYIF